MPDDPASLARTAPATDEVWEALARHLAGEGTQAERDSFERALAAHPERAALLHALDGATRLVVSADESHVDVERALARARSSRDVIALRPPRASSVPGRRRMAVPWRVAAGVLVVAGATLVWRGATDRHIAPTPVAGATTYVAPVGESRAVRLGDGTRIVLAPGSEVLIGPGFGASAREVGLRGEALFDVAHDYSRPFTVLAGDAVIRDVGTVFTVHAAEQGGVAVSVSSGSVELTPVGAPTNAAVVLHAGDAGSLHAGRVVVTRGGAAGDDTAFVHGRLIWRDAPLARVIADLKRWYGVTLIVSDSGLAQRHLTASFAGESAGDVLRVVAAALGGELRQSADTAYISRAGGEPAQQR